MNLEITRAEMLPDGTSAHPPRGERRACKRFPVRWPLSFSTARSNARTFATITEEISSRGFRCAVEESIPAGENIECMLRFPLRSDSAASRAMRCQASVVWVSPMDDGRFIIGCRIDDYTVVGKAATGRPEIP